MTLTEGQARLRRSKQSERDLGHFLLTYNGKDDMFKHIASPTTGRVGQFTELQFDVASRDYAAENKNVRVPKTLLGWWDQICTIAKKHGKEPLLRIDPTNDGKHQEMHIITKARHAELLGYEGRYKDIDK